MKIVFWKYEYQIDIGPDTSCRNGFEICESDADVETFIYRFEGWLQDHYWGASGNCVVSDNIPVARMIEFSRPYKSGHYGLVDIERTEEVPAPIEEEEDDDE